MLLLSNNTWLYWARTPVVCSRIDQACLVDQLLASRPYPLVPFPSVGAVPGTTLYPLTVTRPANTTGKYYKTVLIPYRVVCVYVYNSVL